MQIKSTMRYHLAPAEQPSAKSLQIMNSGEKETLLHCYWECKFVQPLWRTIWKFLRKKKKKTKQLKIELSYKVATPFLGIHSEKIKIRNDMCTPVSVKHCLPGHESDLNVHPLLNG